MLSKLWSQKKSTGVSGAKKKKQASWTPVFALKDVDKYIPVAILGTRKVKDKDSPSGYQEQVKVCSTM